MTNQPGDLRMFVRSEYDVECKRCGGSGDIYPDDFIDENCQCDSDKILCTICHGTGKRTVTLEGWVAVENWSTNEKSRYILRPENKGVLGIPGNGEETTKQIADWHRAGVLPKEYYKSDTNPMGLNECDRS